MNKRFSFIKKNKFRIGEIITPHGIITTPNFVPVATNAVIKSCTSEQINALNVELMFCNTYHLMVHPGENTVERAGGLHAFMNRNAPIITDSGGFQVFSLMYGGVHQELKSNGSKKHENSVVKINEEGVTFQSYFDGRKILLTPEISIQAQKKLGADIIIPFDELLPFHVEESRFTHSFYRTHRWQLRSLEEHKKNTKEQLIYAVIHGGVSSEYRKKSCEILSKEDFDGFAIGGSLGKNIHDVKKVLEMTIDNLPNDKPRHLLGIADLPTLIMAIQNGIDTFDSSYPTKCGRHGVLFTDQGLIKIKQGKWKEHHKPLSLAPLCNQYTAAYIHHLFKAHENTGGIIASLHNIWYIINLCNRIKNDLPVNLELYYSNN